MLLLCYAMLLLLLPLIKTETKIEIKKHTFPIGLSSFPSFPFYILNEFHRVPYLILFVLAVNQSVSQSVSDILL